MFTRPIPLPITCDLRIVIGEKSDKLAQPSHCSHPSVSSHFIRLFSLCAASDNSAKTLNRGIAFPEQAIGFCHFGNKLLLNNLRSPSPSKTQLTGMGHRTSSHNSPQAIRKRRAAISCKQQNSPLGHISQEANRHPSKTLSGFLNARGAKQGVNA